MQQNKWGEFFENNEYNEPVNHAPVNLSTVELSGGEVLTITNEQLLANAVDVDGDNLSVVNVILESDGATLIHNNDNIVGHEIDGNLEISDGYETIATTANININEAVNNTATTLSLETGQSIEGNIGTRYDQDWIRVELDGNNRYQIDLTGSPTGGGNLRDTYLRGIYDENGNMINGTTNDDGGIGLNSRLDFTTSEAGTYYISAGAYGSHIGTYSLSIDDISVI